MTKSIDKDQIALDRKKKQEQKKMDIMNKRMQFFTDGLRELQAKCQVKLMPVLRTLQNRIEANVELQAESEKTLEECLAEYEFKKNEERLAKEKSEGEAKKPKDQQPKK